jgi:hypothetical protein
MTSTCHDIRIAAVALHGDSVAALHATGRHKQYSLYAALFIGNGNEKT